MQPFFFGASRRALFGVHHPARGSARRTAVVVCAPFGQEYLRSHRCLRELASRLAEAGFPTLRFDLFGTGDSAGDLPEAEVEGWLADVQTAAAEAREASGGTRVAFVGLRFGATLAALAAAREKASAVVLWDPVVQGSAFLEELLSEHRYWLREHAPGAAAGDAEAFGFSMGEPLLRSLRALDLATLREPPAPRLLHLSTAASSREPAPWTWPGLESRRLAPAPVWRNVEGMEHALVPVPALAAVTEWLREACP